MDETTPLVSNVPEAPSHSGIKPAIEEIRKNEHDNQATVNCQVCKAVISFPVAEKQIIVRCPKCTEATPIKGPPPGKQFVRCPCNCLLVCNTQTTRVGCPRPQCQRVIVLSENDLIHRPSLTTGGTGTYGSTFGTPLNLRIICGNCGNSFSLNAPEPHQNGCVDSVKSCLSCGNATGLIAAQCPHCRKVTSVGPAYSRVRWIMYGILCLVALIVAISVTASTAESAKQTKSLYFLWAVLYALVPILGFRAVRFLKMPISNVDVPTLQI